MAKIDHEKMNRLNKTRTSKKEAEGKKMKSKYSGTCCLCNDTYSVGSNIYYIFFIKKAVHLKCKVLY